MKNTEPRSYLNLAVGTTKKVRLFGVSLLKLIDTVESLDPTPLMLLVPPGSLGTLKQPRSHTDSYRKIKKN